MVIFAMITFDVYHAPFYSGGSPYAAAKAGTFWKDGYLVGGISSGGFPYYDDFYLVELDTLGNVVNTAIYPTEYLMDVMQSLFVQEDGSVICTGHRYYVYKSNASIILKYDENLSMVWEKGISSPYEYNFSIPFHGGFLACGSYGTDLFFEKYEDSMRIWNRIYDFGGKENAFAGIEVPDGALICGTGGDHDFLVVKIDTAGDTMWYCVWGDSLWYERITGIECVLDGFIAVGTKKLVDTLGDTSYLYLAKIDPTGSILWEKVYRVNGGNAVGKTIKITSNGNLVVCGTAQWSDSSRMWLLTVDENGDTLWTRILPSIGNDSAAFAFQTPDGGYFIGGTAYSGTSMYMHLLKTDSSGFIPQKVKEKEKEKTMICVSYANMETEEKGMAILYDGTGRRVKIYSLKPGTNHISLEEFPPGVYMFVVRTKEKRKAIKVLLLK